jgi:predicted Zn-dependent protease
MRISRGIATLSGALLLLALPALGQVQRATPGDSDNTLRAMKDELERSRERLRLGELEQPFYIEYRLLDLDVRSFVASFGALQSSNAARTRSMAVDVRVGDYKVDSSNFVSSDGFQGFLGSTGNVGIDRDYESLRQDLWLSTDQAYKQALDSIARKRAFMRNLAQPTNIEDFSREAAVVLVQPLQEPDWSSRNWAEEARAVSRAFRAYPALSGSRVTYYLVHTTYYLMTSEGTQIRLPRTFAAIEAGIETQADDGALLHNFYTAYARRPGELPAPAAVHAELDRISRELVALRAAAPAPDYTGPVLFESRAAAALLGQALGSSVSGARPPVSMMPFFDQMMERLGGRNEWTGRVGQRVLPMNVSLVDDPAAKDFHGQPLLGGYDVDDEGVRAQRVTLVENGLLRNFLMSRRPGPDLQQSNGHGRAAFLGEPKAVISNLILQADGVESPAVLKKKFLDACRADGKAWCLAVRQMDNPVLGVMRQRDGQDLFAALASGASAGDRLPLLTYRVYVEDGREELVRGAWLTGVTLRDFRNIAAIGDDHSVFTFHHDPQIIGTALGSFGTAQSGLTSSVVAPSLLLEEVEVRGYRPAGTRRPPLLPAPPLPATP